MLNNVVLVGRVVATPTIDENEKSVIKLAIQRSYKNENGETDTDFIKVILWKTIAIQTCDYVQQGDILGVKGRLICLEDKMEVVAEKVTFLSNGRKKDE